MTSALGTAAWYGRYALPGGRAVVVSVGGPGFPDGTVVDLPGPPAHPAGWGFEAHIHDPGHVPVTVRVSPDLVPSSPHLWFVLGPAGTGGAVDLVAFSTAALDDGRVVGVDQLAVHGVTWADQVGAVRWSPVDGLASQVYVAPRFRRRGIATRLLVTADAVRFSQGWPALVGDGRMTDLGDAWLSAQPELWRARVPAGGERPPPMTPAHEAVGLPARLLVRDGSTPPDGVDGVAHRR